MIDVAKLLERFCSEYEGGITFCQNYSGRGMDGRTCFGIAVTDDTQPFELALALAGYTSETEYVTPYKLHEVLGGSCMDSMGLGYIIYFPCTVCCDQQAPSQKIGRR